MFSASFQHAYECPTPAILRSHLSHPMLATGREAQSHIDRPQDLHIAFDHTSSRHDSKRVISNQNTGYQDTSNARRSPQHGQSPSVVSTQKCRADLHVVDNDSTYRHSDHSSSDHTWSSSEHVFEMEDKEFREPFIVDYNALAVKYHMPIIVPEGYETVTMDDATSPSPSHNWLVRKFLRRITPTQASHDKTEKIIRHRRSTSDLSSRMRTSKKDSLQGKSLHELLRICGSSPLHLPPEYAPCTLKIPTCFRATAQYLLQYGPTTRGIFRIPGPKNSVDALYDHYASGGEVSNAIDGTVHCPTLPGYVRYDVHDVASAFKKFLAGLPNGILGSVWLFETLLSVHSFLDGESDSTKVKYGRVRTKLIALAIASVSSRYERELICMVMGLLSMIGRTAETARLTDDSGRLLPTSDLMSYKSLGVVFGPLLMGDMSDLHTVQMSTRLDRDGHPLAGELNLPKARRGRHKKSNSEDDGTYLRVQVEKVRLANDVTEMLITHWRAVVGHLKSMGGLGSVRDHHLILRHQRHQFPRSSMIEHHDEHHREEQQRQSTDSTKVENEAEPVIAVDGNFDGPADHNRPTSERSWTKERRSSASVDGYNHSIRLSPVKSLATPRSSNQISTSDDCRVEARVKFKAAPGSKVKAMIARFEVPMYGSMSPTQSPKHSEIDRSDSMLRSQGLLKPRLSVDQLRQRWDPQRDF